MEFRATSKAESRELVPRGFAHRSSLRFLKFSVKVARHREWESCCGSLWKKVSSTLWAPSDAREFLLGAAPSELSCLDGHSNTSMLHLSMLAVSSSASVPCRSSPIRSSRLLPSASAFRRARGQRLLVEYEVTFTGRDTRLAAPPSYRREYGKRCRQSPGQPGLVDSYY